MKLVFKYMAMHLKSQLEYRSSFILSFIAQVFPTALSALMVFILLDKFNFTSKVDPYEVMLAVSIVQFGFGCAECFWRGFDKFSDLIKHGKLDLMLIKPRSIYLQVFGSNIEFAKLSRGVGGLILFIIAITHIKYQLTFFSILLLVGLLIFSFLIYVALYILAACLCFKTIEGLEFTNIFTDGSREFGQYPMSIFRKEVLIFFTYIIPIACVNYYPIKYIFGNGNNLLYLISPLFCFVLLGISILTFNACMKYYASSGS